MSFRLCYITFSNFVVFPDLGINNATHKLLFVSKTINDNFNFVLVLLYSHRLFGDLIQDFPLT